MFFPPCLTVSVERSGQGGGWRLEWSIFAAIRRRIPASWYLYWLNRLVSECPAQLLARSVTVKKWRHCCPLSRSSRGPAPGNRVASFWSPHSHVTRRNCHPELLTSHHHHTASTHFVQASCHLVRCNSLEGLNLHMFVPHRFCWSFKWLEIPVSRSSYLLDLYCNDWLESGGTIMWYRCCPHSLQFSFQAYLHMWAQHRGRVSDVAATVDTAALSWSPHWSPWWWSLIVHSGTLECLPGHYCIAVHFAIL